MKAVILVGGLGTRLRALIPDLPKPMAPIQDKPFLAYLLHYLRKQGITHVILPIYYKGETIRAYFKAHYAGIDIQYVEESEPLGTGGAILNALNPLSAKDASDPLFILNGDTFVTVDYRGMFMQHQKNEAKLTIALRAIDDCARYGKVNVSHNEITQFNEKGETGPGLINAGVYLLAPTLFTSYSLPRKFSFETDFLFPHAAELKANAFVTDDYFIDIGIPEDYHRANDELPLFWNE